MVTVAPFGSWSSPITADRLVDHVVGLGHPTSTPGHVWWTEQRPAEGGRVALVRVPLAGGPAEEVTAPEHHVRSTVHEYGGLAYVAADDLVVFVAFDDQRLVRLRPGGAAEPITPPPPARGALRYAAPVLATDGRHCVAVRERHPVPDDPGGVRNDLVVVPTDGSWPPRVVVDGHDFYAHPVLSPDGRRLAWVQWDHPAMPWDATELWEADLDADLVPVRRRKVAGGPGESVTQPSYAPDGCLHFVSDRSGWWNVYGEAHPGGPVRPVVLMEADIGEPDWVFGTANYALLGDGSVVVAWWSHGLAHLGLVRPGRAVGGPDPSPVELLADGWTSVGFVRATADGAAVTAIAGGPAIAPCVVTIDPVSGAVTVLARSQPDDPDPDLVSAPEAVTFAGSGGAPAHALFYPPRNPAFRGPSGERPPCIVRSHGGPTSAAVPVLNQAVQFWTSRGFAVVDVNYGGSSGFGRAYRDRLRGGWGVVDVDDCVAATRHLVEAGRIDEGRLCIHGGSAGGYTTLCALTFRHEFAAGASRYGVADVAALARDTHKFESRYLDGLIGPWPDAEAVYRARSPAFHTDRLRTPTILFQGTEDKVVPPNQAEAMADALDAKGIPHAYVVYEGEGHGFRRAETIRHAAEAELAFYGQVLGFTPADALAPLPIRHGERLAGCRPAGRLTAGPVAGRQPPSPG